MRLTRPPAKQPPETIISLIDVVFFLLVFFMLIGRMDATAPFEVTPPTALTGADMPAGGVTLSVSAGGILALDGELIEPDRLAEALSDRSTKADTPLIRINAHRRAELRNVLPLVSKIEALGGYEVVLVVTPEAAQP